MGTLQLARRTDFELANIEIPSTLVDIPGGDLGDLERFMQQAQLAISGFKSGLAVSASLLFLAIWRMGQKVARRPFRLMRRLFLL